MKRDEYLAHLHKAYVSGKISDAAYDAAIMNVDIFCDDDDDDIE